MKALLPLSRRVLCGIACLSLSLAAAAQEKVEAYSNYTQPFGPFENSELKNGFIGLRVYPLDVEDRLWESTGMIRITRSIGPDEYSYVMMDSHKGPYMQRTVVALDKRKDTYADRRGRVLERGVFEETRKALQDFVAELQKQERMIARPAHDPDVEPPYVLIEQITDGKYSSSLIHPEAFALHRAKIDELTAKFAKAYTR